MAFLVSFLAAKFFGSGWAKALTFLVMFCRFCMGLSENRIPQRPMVDQKIGYPNVPWLIITSPKLPILSHTP